MYCSLPYNPVPCSPRAFSAQPFPGEARQPAARQARPRTGREADAGGKASRGEEVDSSSAFGLGSWRKREERGKGQNRRGGWQRRSWGERKERGREGRRGVEGSRGKLRGRFPCTPSRLWVTRRPAAVPASTSTMGRKREGGVEGSDRPWPGGAPEGALGSHVAGRDQWGTREVATNPEEADAPRRC